MSIPGLPPAHDLVRLIRPTRAETAEALRDFFLLTGDPPPWSYLVARALAGAAFSRSAPLSAILHAVAVGCRTKGVGPNAEVVRLIWSEGEGRTVRCYAPPKGHPLRVRQDLQVSGQANFYYVEHKRPTIVFVQPRRGFNPSEYALGLLGALLRETLAIDDFAGANIQIFDFSTQGGKCRITRILSLNDLPLLGDAELTDAMQLVADAYEDVKSMGIDWDALEQRRRQRDAEWKRRRDERRRKDQDDMFDP